MKTNNHKEAKAKFETNWKTKDSTHSLFRGIVTPDGGETVYHCIIVDDNKRANRPLKEILIASIQGKGHVAIIASAHTTDSDKVFKILNQYCR